MPRSLAQCARMRVWSRCNGSAAVKPMAARAPILASRSQPDTLHHSLRTTPPPRLQSWHPTPSAALLSSCPAVCTQVDAPGTFRPGSARYCPRAPLCTEALHFAGHACTGHRPPSPASGQTLRSLFASPPQPPPAPQSTAAGGIACAWRWACTCQWRSTCCGPGKAAAALLPLLLPHEGLKTRRLPPPLLLPDETPRDHSSGV